MEQSYAHLLGWRWFALSLVLASLLIGLGYLLGYHKGKARTLAGEVTVARLVIPLEVLRLIGEQETETAIRLLEKTLDTGVLTAVEWREHPLLSEQDKTNLDRALGKVLQARAPGSYLNAGDEKLKPEFRDRLNRAVLELLHEENGN